MLTTREQVISQFSDALSKGRGAFFVGSGISKESRLPDWDELLRSYSYNIYSVAKNRPLPLVAQYIVTESMGNDFALKSFIAGKLSTRHIANNKFLCQIAKSKINKIWTTNYDTLIEDSLGHTKCTVNVGDHNIDKGPEQDTIEIIKMHGCRKSIDHMILTQDDYDFFPYNNPNTCRRLLSDMSESLFLFIGYGFRDHNIHNVLRASQWQDRTHVKRHFLITKKCNDEPELQKLWEKDLIRYGIYVLYINEYDDLEDILKEIALKSRGSRIYVTGSHKNEKNLIAEEIGRFLAQKDEIVILDGQSQGVGATVLKEFNAECLKLRKERATRLESFHNPYAVDAKFADTEELMDSLKKHREPLFRNAQLVVLFDGGIGTRAEFQLAEERGCNIIPVPTLTGHAQYTEFMEKEVLSSERVCNYLTLFSSYREKIDRREEIFKEDVIECLNKAISLFL